MNMASNHIIPQTAQFYFKTAVCTPLVWMNRIIKKVNFCDVNKVYAIIVLLFVCCLMFHVSLDIHCSKKVLQLDQPWAPPWVNAFLMCGIGGKCCVRKCIDNYDSNSNGKVF